MVEAEPQAHSDLHGYAILSEARRGNLVCDSFIVTPPIESLWRSFPTSRPLHLGTGDLVYSQTTAGSFFCGDRGSKKEDAALSN